MDKWIGEAYPFGGRLMSNWYVIQVLSGHEEKIVKQCDLFVSKEALKECFIPYVKRVKKFRGKWHEVEEMLFKGYVFMISDDVEVLYNELKKIPELTKMLGKYDRDIYPLNKEEIDFLKCYGKEDHKVDMSIGYIEGDSIKVMRGPLMGQEGRIKKVDRHKRIAYVEVDFFNKITMVKVGLEIIRKNE